MQVNLIQKKKAEHIPSGYSIVTCCSFDKSKNKQKYYRGKDCMIMFCKDLKKQAMKIINYEKKKIIPLTDKEKKHTKIRKFVIYVKKILVNIKKVNVIKIFKKLETIVIIQDNIGELLIVYVI